jgi:hypothetical protein
MVVRPGADRDRNEGGESRREQPWRGTPAGEISGDLLAQNREKSHLLPGETRC